MPNLLMKTKLLEHQKQAFDKIKNLKVSGLFMEMGTGKTRVTLELINHKYSRGKIDKVIYFCPASIIVDTELEIRKHCQNIEISTNRNITSFLNIVSIEAVSQSQIQYLWLCNNINERTMLIVDESSRLKNYGTKRATRFIGLGEKAIYKTILTGTPISNGIQDLYVQFAFLSKKIIGYSSYYSFLNNHVNFYKYRNENGLLIVTDKIVSAREERYIAAKIAPYIFQITSKECLDLPKTIYKRRYVKLTRKQEFVYKQVKRNFLIKATNEGFTELSLLTLFIKLQQICSNYWNGGIIDENIRVLETQSVLSELQEKTIILFKYDTDAEQLSNHFGIEAITGKVTKKKREKIIANFRKDQNVLLANVGCLSHGLNLQFAKNIIYYNNVFSWEKREQSEKRIHRFNQENVTIYIDIVAKDTIDEKIHECILKKETLANYFKQEIEEIRNCLSKEEAKEKLSRFLERI
jgi:Superfamily II DNA/RNA helicases, SNF2 family